MYVCHCGEVALCGHDVFLVLLRRTEESRLCRVRIGYNPSGLTAPLIKPASTARRAFLSRRWSNVGRTLLRVMSGPLSTVHFA